MYTLDTCHTLTVTVTLSISLRHRITISSTNLSCHCDLCQMTAQMGALMGMWYSVTDGVTLMTLTWSHSCPWSLLSDILVTTDIILESGIYTGNIPEGWKITRNLNSSLRVLRKIRLGWNKKILFLFIVNCEIK